MTSFNSYHCLLYIAVSSLLQTTFIYTNVSIKVGLLSSTWMISRSWLSTLAELWKFLLLFNYFCIFNQVIVFRKNLSGSHVTCYASVSALNLWAPIVWRFSPRLSDLQRKLDHRRFRSKTSDVADRSSRFHPTVGDWLWILGWMYKTKTEFI